MNSKRMTLNDFLGHKTREGGNYLKKWQKRQPPRIDLALHTTAPMAALWQHGKPRVQEVRRDGSDPVREAWGGTANCIEQESVLRSQYRRASETDERETPPRVCPVCILIETVRTMVRQGKLGFTQPIFRWVGDDPQKAITVSAAGMWNGYQDEKFMTREQVVEMRKAGVKKSEAWRENMMAKCNYVFVIADIDDPQSGAMITTETTAVGDAMRRAIRDRMTQLGEDDGNPFLNPVAFRWEHFPNEPEFGKKYKVLPMPKLDLAEVLPIIKGDPPAIEHIVKAPNFALLRADYEQACLVDLPWDDIFGPAEDIYSSAGPSAGDDIGAEEAANLPVPTTTLTTKKAQPANDADDDKIQCDECGREMTLEEFECAGCGAKYDEAGNVIPKEPKPVRRRSAAAAAKAPAPVATASAAKKPMAATAIRAPAKVQPDKTSAKIDEIFAGDDFPPWAR